MYSLQERCILDGTLTVNYEQVDTEYRLRHNDLLANIVHRSAPAPASQGHTKSWLSSQYLSPLCGTVQTTLVLKMISFSKVFISI